MTGLVDIPIEVSAAGRTRYGVHGAECAAVIKSDGSVYEIRNTPGLDASELRKKWDAPRAEGALQVFSTARGFAALLENGAVVSWSNGSPYGTFEDVADGLKANVLGVAGTDDSFAAIKRDGSVITWGGRAAASDSRRVASALSSDVVRVFSSGKEFAALKRDGSVVSWGYLTPPRDPSDEPLDGIIEVFGNEGAFAGLKEDGSVVMFGPAASYTASYVESLKSLGTFGKARWIYTTRYHFAALVDTGRVVTWGRDGIADNVPPAAGEGVVHIVANDEAFAAIKDDGSVVTWRPGRRDTNPGVVANTNGGDSSAVSEKLRRGVETVVATKTAFAALMTNGSVVTWGGGPEGDGGGDSRVVAEELRGGVVDIVANQFAFAAVKNNGGVVCWGKDSAKKFSAGFVRQALVENDGRWSIAEDEQRILAKMLSAGCVDIATTDDAFVAMTETGAVIPWGGRRSQKETFDSHLVDEKARIAATGVAHLATPLSSGVLVGAPVAGIAIAHNAASEDVHGVWEYRPQASRNWRPIPRDVSNSSAIALGTTTRIRFRPNAGFYGTPGGLMMTLLTDPSRKIRDGDRANITDTPTLGWLPISTTCPAFRPQDDVANKDDGGMKGPSPLDTPLSATEKRGDDEINLFSPPAGKSRKGTGRFQNQASDAVGLIDEWGIAVCHSKLDPSGPSPPEGLVVLECLPLGRELGFSEGDSITRFDTYRATPASVPRALEQYQEEDELTITIRGLEERFKLPARPFSPWEIQTKLPAASEGYRPAEKLVIKRSHGDEGPVAAAAPQARLKATYLFRYGNWKGEWKRRPAPGKLSVFDCTMTNQGDACTATYVATVWIDENSLRAQLKRTDFVHSVDGPEADQVFEGERSADGKKITWTKFGYVTLVE
jgi:alpha-tubulin suppressor-like RCC1 family protein